MAASLYKLYAYVQYIYRREYPGCTLHTHDVIDSIKQIHWSFHWLHIPYEAFVTMQTGCLLFVLLNLIANVLIPIIEKLRVYFYFI